MTRLQLAFSAPGNVRKSAFSEREMCQPACSSLNTLKTSVNMAKSPVDTVSPLSPPGAAAGAIFALAKMRATGDGAAP